MKRKVCQISSAHKRYDARIFRKIARSLAANGFESYFLICDSKPNEVIDGVRIVSNGFVAKNQIQRITKSWKTLKRLAIEIDAEIYQIHDPELFSLGHFLLRRGKKVIFDCHEDYRYIAEKNYIPRCLRRLALAFYLKKEKQVCRKFSGVITVTPSVTERLSPFAKRIEMITNFPVLTENPFHEPPQESRVCFGGNCGWMHESLVRVLPDFHGKIRYSLVTNLNDPCLDKLKALPGWEYVDLYGYMTFEELREIYQKSSFGFAVFPYCAVVNNDEGTLGNTKIFEYMMDGLPVICSDHKIWKEIIEGEQCGIAVNPNDIQQLREAIEKLAFDKNLLDRYGKNGRLAAEKKYNWSTQEKKLIDFYEQILREK